MGNVEREVPRSSVARHSSLEPSSHSYFGDIDLPVVLYKGGSPLCFFLLIGCFLMLSKSTLCFRNDRLIEGIKFLFYSSSYEVNIE